MEKSIIDSGCKIELPDEKNNNIKVIPQKLTNYTPGANAIVFDVQPNMKEGMTFDVFDKSNVFVEKLVVGSINGNTINLLKNTTTLANCPCIVTFKSDIVSNNINTDPTVIIPLRYNIDTPSTVIIPLRYNIGVTSKITNYTSGSNSITFDSKPDVQPGATFEVYDKSNTFVEKLIAGSIIGNTVNLLNTTTTPANCPCVATFKPKIVPSNIDSIPNINDSGSTVIIPIRLITTLASSSTSSSSNTPPHVGSKTISANVGVLDGPPVDNIPITVGP